MPYHHLTTEQLAQVQYLFADHVFGTDAGAYLYEVDAAGNITGRRMAQKTTARTRAKQSPRFVVHVLEASHVSEAQVRAAQNALDALSAQIAKELYKQKEQVTP